VHVTYTKSPCHADVVAAAATADVGARHEGAPMLMLAKETEQRSTHAVKMQPAEAAIAT
jgi:hypothetical protein